MPHRLPSFAACLVAFTACACPAPPPGAEPARLSPAPSTASSPPALSTTSAPLPPSTASAPPAPVATASGGLAALEFMTGSWTAAESGGQTEEFWMPSHGGTMLGVARVISGDRTAFFEFMRIEQQADEIILTVMPRGTRAVPFKLVELRDGQAVFANPEHDFPKRIIYRKEPDGALVARLDSGPQPDVKAKDIRFVRSH